MKKALSLLLAFVMVLSLVPMTVFAAAAPTIYFETNFTEDMTVGDTFYVTANLKDNVVFSTMTLSLKWNESAISFTGFNVDRRGGLDTEVYTYSAPVFNQELGIVTGSDYLGYDTNGRIFTANFKIIAEEGDLGIGLKTADATEFEMLDLDDKDLGTIIDTSAINGLAVGGVSSGPEMPEDAPFTAITTDAGPIVDIEQWDDLDVDPWGSGMGTPVVHYHITVSEDTTEAYVRFALSVDNFVSQNFMIGENEIGSAYASVNHDDLDVDAESGMAGLQYGENGDDYTVMIIPMEFAAGDMVGNVGTLPAVKGEDELYYAVGPQDNGGNTYAVFSFEYDDGLEEYNISIDENMVGGTIYACDEDGNEITKAKAGETVFVEVEADEGYTTPGAYYINGQIANDFMFVMPEEDVVLTATFQKQHTHVYDKEVAADKYLKDAATCQSGAVYYKSCECSEFVTTADTFVSGETVGCVYENGTCKWCGEAAAAGYTVTMSEDAETVAGEEVTVSVAVGHTNETVTKYNAFDMTFAYNATALELLTTEIEGMDITVEGGKIHIKRYGSDLALTTPVVSLKFKALAAGTTEVKLVSAKVDIADKALTQDAPEAIVNDAATAVTVTGYAINLSEDFQGETNAEPGKDYTFTAKDKNYNYTVTATVNGQAITVTDNGDGTFTIPANQITGAVTVTATKTGETFTVTVGDDLAGAEQAQYMTDYTAKLTKEAGYGYTITVTIGGTEYKGFAYDEATGVITIPGKDITGAVVINTGKVSGEFTVTFAGAGAGEARGESVAEGGKAYTFTIEAAPGYTYAVTYIMGDATEAIELTAVEGKYTIEKVTADIVITIEKTSDLAVEVKEYVKLNGKSVMLITATQTLAEGEALSYDGTVMFYSEQYKAWCYLVIAEGTLTAEEAKTAITNGVAKFTTLTQTYNVNGVGTVDINDAQLVYNLYNNMYQDFTVATMEKFLNADVNGDKVINVTDAAAVVSQIANAK